MKIFTNGCFDILHRGHLELLEYCRHRAGQHGSFFGVGEVIVGLNSDDSIRELKGDGRPINNERDRKYALEALKYVDTVIVFNEPTPLELIKIIKPDIIIKGGDYEKENVVGSDLCDVIIFKLVEGYSTTNIIKNNLNDLSKGSYEGGHY